MKRLREKSKKVVDFGVVFVEIDRAHGNQKIDINSK